MSNSPDNLAVDLRSVAKIYRRKVHALRGIQMRLPRGEIFGLLGPNGAGKSTLVKIMMTVIRPTSAEGTVLGQPIGHKGTLARVGYLPEHHRFPPYLTGRQALEYYAALAKVDRKTRRRRASELLELVGMREWERAKVKTYSKGMQQRIGLAQSMMNDPDLIVLDEPTDGLDPVGRRDVREILVRMRDQGKTVLLNSHLLGEVEQICDRVAILIRGSVVHQGSIQDLTSAGRHYEVDVQGPPSPELTEAISAALPCSMALVASATPSDATPTCAVEEGRLPLGVTVKVARCTVKIESVDTGPVQTVIDALRAGQLVIESVRPVRQSLEDFFVGAVADS